MYVYFGLQSEIQTGSDTLDQDVRAVKGNIQEKYSAAKHRTEHHREKFHIFAQFMAR